MRINKFYKTTMTPNKFICYLKCVLIFPSQFSGLDEEIIHLYGSGICECDEINTEHSLTHTDAYMEVQQHDRDGGHGVRDEAKRVRLCRGFIRPFWSRRRCHNLFITWYYLERKAEWNVYMGTFVSVQTPNGEKMRDDEPITHVSPLSTLSLSHWWVHHTNGGMSLVKILLVSFSSCPLLSAHKDLFYSFERFRFTFWIVHVLLLTSFHTPRNHPYYW